MVEKISDNDDIYDNFNPNEDVYEFSSTLNQHSIKMNENEKDTDLIKDYYDNSIERKKLSCYQSVRLSLRSHIFHSIVVTLVRYILYM
jgi:hypothetical protein